MEMAMYVLGFYAFVLTVEWMLRKRFEIGHADWGFYRPINSVHKRIERLILLLFMIGLWFFKGSAPFFIIIVLLSMLVRTFMEWKYKKESKEYLLTLFSGFNFLLFLWIASLLGFI
ncbi:hypothetical protein A8F94_09690 [Bacillus sp. FJAT-27225]|uniref:DUF4181 domain-containing protein n=1 Tax=Bacillus sp. FJAT-27225 TaxID=1743144 RepID=UPI00080C2833|nr:DUF4181 domain-containing protein [Bacillus sp. FJAT-27225]OCA88081.1 hypothetical protein A8F94_09690 [Bacillus sp. FJAT-27225]